MPLLTGATNDYEVVVTFANPVTVTGNPQAKVVSAPGTVGSGGASNGGAVTVAGPVVTVPLTNVPNAQTTTVILHGVNTGSNYGNVTIPMSLLIGDVNNTRAVNATDVSQTKLQSGQAASATNFRSDVVVSGAISATDVSRVKLGSGTALPP